MYKTLFISPVLCQRFIKIFSAISYKFSIYCLINFSGLLFHFESVLQHKSTNFCSTLCPFLSIQKPDQREAYTEGYIKINQTVGHCPFYTNFTFYERESKKRRKCFSLWNGGREGGEPPRVTFDFEPDRLDPKGLSICKCWALSTA